MFNNNFFFLGFLSHYKIYQNQFSIINQKIDQIINKIEPKKRQFKNKTNQLIGDKKYSKEIENLWMNFKLLFDKRLG